MNFSSSNPQQKTAPINGKIKREKWKNENSYEKKIKILEIHYVINYLLIQTNC